MTSIDDKLKDFAPEIIEDMKQRGPEMFLLLVELWKDAAKGGINRNLILKRAKLLLGKISIKHLNI